MFEIDNINNFTFKLNIVLFFIHITSFIISLGNNFCFKEYDFSILVQLYLCFRIFIDCLSLIFCLTMKDTTRKFIVLFFISFISLLGTLTFEGFSFYIVFTETLDCFDISFYIFIIYLIYPSLENYLFLFLFYKTYKRIKIDNENYVNDITIDISAFTYPNYGVN
jgi:hypothetical protein